MDDKFYVGDELARIANALERIAKHFEDSRARDAIQDEEFKRLVDNQSRLITQHDEAINQAKEHIARCDEWHRQHLAVQLSNDKSVN